MNSPTTIVADRHLPEGIVARVDIDNGTIEALKWVGLILMTLDNTNKYLFANSLEWAFAAGRLAMPIFGFVLAYNLARPGALANGLYGRTMKRLGMAGLAATPFFVALGGLIDGWWPLNIMFMLLVSTGVAYLAERGGPARMAAALGLFVVGGAMVEFWWPAIVFVLAMWQYFKTVNKWALGLAFVALTSLFAININLWALAAIPIMLLAPQIQCDLPRLRHVFYVFYPVHLAALLLLSKAV